MNVESVRTTQNRDDILLLDLGVPHISKKITAQRVQAPISSLPFWEAEDSVVFDGVTTSISTSTTRQDFLENVNSEQTLLHVELNDERFVVHPTRYYGEDVTGPTGMYRASDGTRRKVEKDGVQYRLSDELQLPDFLRSVNKAQYFPPGKAVDSYGYSTLSNVSSISPLHDDHGIVVSTTSAASRENKYVSTEANATVHDQSLKTTRAGNSVEILQNGLFLTSESLTTQSRFLVSLKDLNADFIYKSPVFTFGSRQQFAVHSGTQAACSFEFDLLNIKNVHGFTVNQATVSDTSETLLFEIVTNKIVVSTVNFDGSTTVLLTSKSDFATVLLGVRAKETTIMTPPRVQTIVTDAEQCVG